MSPEDEKKKNPEASPTTSTEDLQERSRRNDEWADRIVKGFTKGLNHGVQREQEEQKQNQ